MKYMHTMMGSPAEFQDGHLVFCGRYCRTLAKSLDQIRREQKSNKKWLRQQPNFSHDDATYDYVRINV